MNFVLEFFFFTIQKAVALFSFIKEIFTQNFIKCLATSALKGSYYQSFMKGTNDKLDAEIYS